MARAYGSSAHLLMKREAIYGQAATGNYVCMPFNRCNIDLWLTGLFGDPTSSDNGHGSHDHEFVSGGDILPSYTIEVGMQKVLADDIRAQRADDGPASPTPDNIAAVIDRYPVSERFFQDFTLRQVLLNATKNRSGLSVAGISSQAEGPNIAGDVETTESHAVEESMGAMDDSALTASTI